MSRSIRFFFLSNYVFSVKFARWTYKTIKIVTAFHVHAPRSWLADIKLQSFRRTLTTPKQEGKRGEIQNQVLSLILSDYNP